MNPLTSLTYTVLFTTLALMVIIQSVRLAAWRRWAWGEGYNVRLSDSDRRMRDRVDERIRRDHGDAASWKARARVVDADLRRARGEINRADRRALMADAQLRKMLRGVERTLKRMAAEREGDQ